MKKVYRISLLVSLLYGCSTPYSQLQDHIEEAKERPGDYLFVLDGVILDEYAQNKLSELEAADIAAVEKVSKPTAEAIYGAQAKPQTIIINTKPKL